MAVGELDIAAQERGSAKTGRLPELLHGNPGRARGLTVLQIVLAWPVPAWH